MQKYLISVYRPQDFDPTVSVDAAMKQEIDTLNDEMVAAGVRIFAGGLQEQGLANSLRFRANGQPTLSDGLPSETKEFLDGFWIIEAATAEESIKWGKKACLACKANIQVRPFH